MSDTITGAEVNLSDCDGNAFFVIGRVRREMRLAGIPNATIEEFTREATAGDYDHLLRTCMKYVEVS